MRKEGKVVEYDGVRGSWISNSLDALCGIIEDVIGERIRLQETTDGSGFAIGTADEDGNFWCGGCDPSNFIAFLLDGRFEWRSDYAERNLIQKISALRSGE